MGAARLVRMLLLLETRERVTAREMAAAFEVSVRTVHRDVEALSGAGVPVYAERGAGGGFRLPEGRRFQINGMTPDEAEALPFAGMGGVAAELGLGEAAAGASLKVTAALPPELRTSVIETERRVYVDLDRWDAPPTPVQLLRGLRDAIGRQRVISLRIVGSDGARGTVEVHPMGLVRSNGEWWLVARGADGMIALAIQAIELARATGAQFGRSAGFDLARWWRSWVRSRR